MPSHTKFSLSSMGTIIRWRTRLGKTGIKAFTLTELLFVCGIIALIAGLAIPSFNSINRGSSMRQAERQMVTACLMARQHAITRRQKVLLGIPTQIIQSNGYVRVDMLNRCYFLASVRTDSVARPQEIIGSVEPLPIGVLFEDRVAKNPWSGWLTYSMMETNNVPMFNARGIRFSPNGAIYFKDAEAVGAGNNFKIILTEGRLDLKGKPLYKDDTDQRFITVTAEVKVATGKCSISR